MEMRIVWIYEDGSKVASDWMDAKRVSCRSIELFAEAWNNETESYYLEYRG